MTVAEKVARDLQGLPESAQAEVLDFIEFLKTKSENEERGDWTAFSVTQAMRGMEAEPDLYSENDVKERFG